MEHYMWKTSIGTFIGNEREGCYEFRGIPYAHAKRFEYAENVHSYGDSFDATSNGPATMQKRAWSEFEHLEIPERAFYHREFREGIAFTYDEDALLMNIFVPKDKGPHPVIVYFHGGGFDSGSISESPFDGEALASRGNVVVFVQYRVAIFGYFTHAEIEKRNGHDGNFGLDDMVQSLKWVQDHIAEFKGDKANVTLMGQSAGAMSIQYLLCSPKTTGLFHKAVMMSGAGLFPSFSLPLPPEQTRIYWSEVMDIAGAKTFEEFQSMDVRKVMEAVETQKSRRKDNTRNTMPVVDHYYLIDEVQKIIKSPHEMPLIIGVTNNDMFTAIIAHIAKKYAKKHGAYLYYFDVDAKGDENQAFHSSDLRYMFGTLKFSWRPYDETDQKISESMMDYLSAFASTGDPNHEGAPRWDQFQGKALHITPSSISMGRMGKWKLLKNTLKGDPK